MSRTVQELCARMFMVGFPGKEPGQALEKLIRQGVFGAILFKRNLGSPADTAALCRTLKTFAQRPFLIGIDQEGGRVARLRGSPFTAIPPMRALGERNDTAFAQRVGALLGFELRAVGIDWDFAPVLDVDTNPKNPVIGDRSFHSNPLRVAQLGVALARGLESAGVASCAKHFPGHGDTEQDSHLSLPRLSFGWERLEQTELLPFRAYIDAKLASIMTAHVLFDAVDAQSPATLSPRAMNGLLRQRLGFQGVVVSDDLEMKAIADHYTIPESAVLGALAGVDLFLVCHDAHRQEAAIEALIQAVESGRLPRSRIEEANARLDVLASRFAHGPEDRLTDLGSEAHRALAAGIEGQTGGNDPTERFA